MKPDKYCTIGYGCILSEEQILDLIWIDLEKK